MGKHTRRAAAKISQSSHSIDTAERRTKGPVGNVAFDVPTLPDLLDAGLALVFVGINPSVYSVARGHYFARASNRFWPCLSRSVLSAPVRAALGVEQLLPAHDRCLPSHGIGFTDVVKRPTAKASELSRAELQTGAAELVARLERYRPRVACFQGMTGFRPVAALFGWPSGDLPLGAQQFRLGCSRVFVVPSPSGANASFTRAQQTQWYDLLAAWCASADDNDG